MTGTYHGDPDVPFFHTRDGGRTWRRQTLPIPARYQGGYANTSGPLFFGSKPRQGILYATLIGPDTYPRPGRLHDEAVFITQTAGADWQYRKYPRSCLGLSDVCFADTQHGWILDGNGRHLYGTRNDGRTWRLLTSRFNQQASADKDWNTRTSLDFVSAHVGWALATADNQTLNRHQFALMKTRDGGQHWVYLQPRLNRLWRKN